MKPKNNNRGGIISGILLMIAAASALAIIALLAVILRQNALLRSALEDAEKARAEQMTALDARLSDLTDRVDLIGPEIERQIASTRDRASSDVGRLESRLNRSLTSVQGKLTDLSGLMTRPVPERIVEVPAPPQAAQSAAAAGSAAPESPDVAEEPQPAVPSRRAEEDLTLIQAMKQGAESYKAARYAEAAGLYQTVMDRQPDNLDARLYYSASLFKSNPAASSNYPRIEQNLKIVLQDRRDDSLAMETLGLIASERGRWAEAVEWLSQAAAREPENASILQETGMCAFYAADYKTSQRLLDQACAAAPQRAGLWFEAGNAYAAGGALEEAAARYVKCLAADPRYTAARLKAGLAYAALGRPSDALAHLNAYIAERPDFESLNAAGDCLYAGGDRTGAEARWRQSLGFVKAGAADGAGKSAEQFEKMAHSAWERTDYARCEETAREGLGFGPRPLLSAYLGMSLAALGRTQDGNTILRKVIEDSPDTEAARLAKQDLEKRGE